MNQAIKGILFDLGDTLLDFGRVDIRSHFESGARQAYDYLQSRGKPLPSFAAYHRRQLWAVRWNVLKSRFTRREFNALDIIGRQGQRLGHNLSPEENLELAWLWYEPLSRCATVEEGEREMLQRLRDRGLVLGLVSNTFIPAPILDRHLQQVNLLDLLPFRVYSCEVGFRKPHNHIFRDALRQTQLAPQETMFVGDSLIADIKGANKAGMISVLKDPHCRHVFSSVRPTHRIESILDLEAIVDRYTTT